MPLEGVSLPLQESSDLLGRQQVWLVMVDDDAEIFGQVMRALGRESVLGIHHFLRIEDFAAAKLQFCDVCIVDAYFDGTSRIRKLIEMIKSRWPDCQIILLSNFADFITPHDRDSIYESLAKPQFLLEPSTLRKILIGAIRHCHGLAPRSVDEAIQSLLRVDPGEGEDQIQVMRHGGICYPLRESTPVEYAKGVYSLKGLSDINGEGETYADARIAFVRGFHEFYQRCRRQLALNEPLTAAENATLSSIVRLIDEPEYEDVQSTITPCELGQLREIDEFGRRHVRWVGGDYDGVENAIDVEGCPFSMLGLNREDYFACVVERRVRSGELIRVLSCQWVDRPEQSPEDRAAFWADVKAARSADEHE